MKSMHCFSLLILALALSAAFATEPEGRVVCNWNEFKAGEAPPNMDNLAVTLKGDGSALVVDAQSNPPSPFPNNESALYLKADSDARAALSILPFPSAPLKGWVEMEVVLKDDKVAVLDIIQSLSGQPVSSGGDILANIFLRPGASLLFRSPDQTQKINVLPKIEEGVPSTVRVAWDFSQQPPVVTFQINGQPGVDAAGEPVSIPLEKANAEMGIDKFRITPFHAFIGTIRASE